MAFSFELNVHIKDPIYGYVELTDLEKRIIETSVFQRLRFITQNGLAFYTFPALRGSRFEHSIGVCHLAGRFMTAAIGNCDEHTLRKLSISFCFFLEEILDPELYADLMVHCDIRKEDLENLSIDKIRGITNFIIQLLRLRGLLHDIGHLPFSHLGEEAVEPHLDQILTKSDISEFEELGCKFHEFIGYKIIMKGLGGLNEAFNRKEGQLFYLKVLQSIYRKKKQLTGNNVYDLLEDMIDSDIDVDRGDYLRRDGYNSGIGFGHYDVDRLIDSIRIALVQRQEGEMFLLAPTDASISPVEDFLLERYKLYKWLYYHHSIKFFNSCLAKALESIIQLEPNLETIYENKFKLEYFHYNRFAYTDGFICNEVWLWDVFYKAFIDLKAIKKPTPEINQALVFLDVIINRAKLGFSVWKTSPGYLEFNKKLKDRLCKVRQTASAGNQYFRFLGLDIERISAERFFNAIYNQLVTYQNNKFKKEFHEKFYKNGVEVPFARVKEFLKVQVEDNEVIGRMFLCVNKFKPFEESQWSKDSDPISKMEFLIRKPEAGKQVIRLTDVSQLVKSLQDVWKADIQCYLFFILSSSEYSELVGKDKRPDLEKEILEFFCDELTKWFEGNKLLQVES